MSNTLYITAPDTGRRLPAGVLEDRPEGLTFTWTVNAKQRLRKWSAYAKDADLIERLYIHGGNSLLLEVLDTVEMVLYTIEMDEFMRRRWLLRTKAGEQWAVDKRHWSQQNV